MKRIPWLEPIRQLTNVQRAFLKLLFWLAPLIGVTRGCFRPCGGSDKYIVLSFKIVEVFALIQVNKSNNWPRLVLVPVPHMTLAVFSNNKNLFHLESEYWTIKSMWWYKQGQKRKVQMFNNNKKCQKYKENIRDCSFFILSRFCWTHPTHPLTYLIANLIQLELCRFYVTKEIFRAFRLQVGSLYRWFHHQFIFFNCTILGIW